MFRQFLVTKDDGLPHLNWVKKIDGVVRVVVFDQSSEAAFVVVYFEQKNQYSVISFDTRTGNFLWQQDVIHGGYGAPAVIGDLVICHTKFTNILALSKHDGSHRWTVETECRVRSAINTCQDKIYFSSGSTILELDTCGQVNSRWSRSGAFFFGPVDIFDELIISLGTLENANEDSEIKVFAFHRSGHLVYELPISAGPIVSSDTCGVIWKGRTGFVGGDNIILCFEAQSGKVIWRTAVEGFAGRQTCVVDETSLYYVTLSGRVGALDLMTGSILWTVKSVDNALVSPISLINNNLMVLADAHLTVLDSQNGQIIHKTPIGHSPYSMVSLNGRHGIVGAGEPPHHGLLLSFCLGEGSGRYACEAQVFNAFIEEAFFDILLKISEAEHEVTAAELDGGIFYLDEPITGEKVAASRFSFRVPIPFSMCPSDYVIPVVLHLDSGDCLTRTVSFKLSRREPLPSRAYLAEIPEISQERPTFSGAAIGSAVKAMYGDSVVDQATLREMVDASRQLGNYEPHDTWRIILRRILTTQATSKDELPEFKR